MWCGVVRVCESYVFVVDKLSDSPKTSLTRSTTIQKAALRRRRAEGGQAKRSCLCDQSLSSKSTTAGGVRRVPTNAQGDPRLSGVIKP
jgi:hypothetical protein